MDRWDQVCSHIYAKAVNYEKTYTELKDLVYHRYLDLAKTYYIWFPSENETENVSDQMLDRWGISKEQLDEQVVKNAAKEGYRLQDTPEFLRSVLPDPYAYEDMLNGNHLYLLTNRRKAFGAGILFDQNSMKSYLQQIGLDCYILPSSVHELLLYPCGQSVGVRELQNTVQEINRTVLSKDEFLSDHVYHCSKDTGRVKFCLPG